MNPALSVIVCSHNPRMDYLQRVLDALGGQTLPRCRWELLLIDNRSDQDLAADVDLGWHPRGRLLRENRLGLSHARMCGIAAAQAPLLVFVDDDNILSPEYLEETLRIADSWPMLGVWGGQTIPEFEVDPPEWTRPYWHLLAIHQFDRDSWSNLTTCGTHPCGAGMSIRTPVAKKWCELVSNDPNRALLGRKGQELMCCEDTDMAFTACDMQLGMGKFATLRLTHLIPADRLTETYLLGVLRGVLYSVVILDSFRNPPPPVPKPPGWRQRFREWLRTRHLTEFERQIIRLEKKMKTKALIDLRDRRAGGGTRP